MNWETELKKRCEEHGVELIIRPNHHYQIKGKLLVNYYPRTMKAYVAGTAAARPNTDVATAVKMSLEVPQAYGRKDKRKTKSTRPLRARMMKNGITKCYWCSIPLTLDSSTLEHIIPLSIGGLDNANNRTLACEPCNRDRGSNMPELSATARRIAQ